MTDELHKMPRPALTPQAKRHLMAHYTTTPNKELARTLGCPLYMVKNFALAQGLRKSKAYIKSGANGKKPFTPKEAAYVRKHYANAPTAVVADTIGHPASSVYRLATRLGLKKSAAFNASPQSGRLQKGNSVGKSSWFQPGQKAHNKGKRMPASVRAKVARTWFTKGHLPHTTTYDGHISVRRDKHGRSYQFIRIALGQHVHLHRKLWTDAHGAVPKGYCVAFKDGDSMNCTLENLECITMAERMRRTSIHNYPPEVRTTMRLLGKLNKTIREHGEQ